MPVRRSMSNFLWIGIYISGCMIGMWGLLQLTMVRRFSTQASTPVSMKRVAAKMQNSSDRDTLDSYGNKLSQEATDRGGLGMECEVGRSRKVKLLVTRHALSCANIVQNWPAKLRRRQPGPCQLESCQAHAKVRDPLLSTAGAKASLAARSDVEAWLISQGATIDAVLVSGLVRTWHTAALQYKGHGKGIVVAPYLSEVGSGDANTPRSITAQVENLKKAVVEADMPVINTKWFDAFQRQSRGKWSDFLQKFLADAFLQDLEGTLPEDKTIVLAIVTHSGYMGRQIGRRCGFLYPKLSARRAGPNNNQVVAMSFVYRTLSCDTERRRKQLVWEEGETCTSVTDGTSYLKKDGSYQRRSLKECEIGSLCRKEFQQADGGNGINLLFTPDSSPC